MSETLGSFCLTADAASLSRTSSDSPAAAVDLSKLRLNRLGTVAFFLRTCARGDGGWLLTPASFEWAPMFPRTGLFSIWTGGGYKPVALDSHHEPQAVALTSDILRKAHIGWYKVLLLK